MLKAALAGRAPPPGWFASRRALSRSIPGSHRPHGTTSSAEEERSVAMIALIVLLLILAIFGGLGFAAHVLWFVLIAAVILWLLGFLIGGVESGVGRRRWYRW
jgi:hypothetical protein